MSAPSSTRLARANGGVGRFRADRRRLAGRTYGWPRRKGGEATHRLTGHKRSTSAPMNDVFLVLRMLFGKAVKH
jgi:hypothetical protein